MSLRTQGTELYFIDPDTNSTVIAVGCATQIGTEGGTVSPVVSHCLETNTPQVDPGTRSETTLTFDINFDPADTSHARLYELFRSDPTVELYFAYGLADGTAAPQAGTEGFDFPASRSFLSFYGFVSAFNVVVAGNSVVSSSITVVAADAQLVPATS